MEAAMLQETVRYSVPCGMGNRWAKMCVRGIWRSPFYLKKKKTATADSLISNQHSRQLAGTYVVLTFLPYQAA